MNEYDDMIDYLMGDDVGSSGIQHHGIKGQKWGVRKAVSKSTGRKSSTKKSNKQENVSKSEIGARNKKVANRKRVAKQIAVRVGVFAAKEIMSQTLLGHSHTGTALKAGRSVYRLAKTINSRPSPRTIDVDAFLKNY